MPRWKTIKLRITIEHVFENIVLPSAFPLPAASVVNKIEILILMTRNDHESWQNTKARWGFQQHKEIQNFQAACFSFQKILELAYEI